MSQPIIEIRDLVKKFGDHEVVSGLDLCVNQGECMGLLGPNGAGKTTTIHMLLGLALPTSGEISIFGMPLKTNLRQIKMRTGVVPQADSLDPDLTVLENLVVYAGYFGIRKKTAKNRAKELLEFFALKSRSNEIIQHLSGGQRRRLLLARALINAPDLLILDEPTVGLDPQARLLIWERLAILRRQGTTMLLTSHYMEEVQRLATRVVILENGKTLAQGVPSNMVREDIGEEVLEFTDSPEKLDALEKEIRECNVTTERYDGRLVVYIREPCREIDEIALSQRHVIKRPPTLEDLFLKLTGRRLKDV
jgi:lipooligosaccharide transport system ATP-binding protein